MTDFIDRFNYIEISDRYRPAAIQTVPKAAAGLLRQLHVDHLGANR